MVDSRVVEKSVSRVWVSVKHSELSFSWLVVHTNREVSREQQQRSKKAEASVDLLNSTFLDNPLNGNLQSSRFDKWRQRQSV